MTSMNLHKETIRALGRELQERLAAQTRLCVAGNRAAAEQLEQGLRETVRKMGRLRTERATGHPGDSKGHRSE